MECSRRLAAILVVSGALAAQPQLVVPLEQKCSMPPPKASAKPAPEVELSDEQLAAQEFFESRIAGHDLQKRVARVRKELRWHTSLADAQRAAQRAERPILWIQAFGNLRGFA